MGDAVEPVKGWGIWVKYRNSPGGFLWGMFFQTRAAAIAHYNEMFEGIPEAYRKHRRAGETKAVRVEIRTALGVGEG